MQAAFASFRPDVVFHLAAETHVDRSIAAPLDFLHTNLLGTGALLQASRAVPGSPPKFIHISTDEVYGTLGSAGAFNESSPYSPRSPYSASKAGSDHLVRSWHETYGLPVIITHSGNNYGPGQFPEKLIPLVIWKASSLEFIPIYGDGCQIRDWIHVEDHIAALIRISFHGRIGETYDIGARDQWRNIDLVRALCRELDLLLPSPPPGGHQSLIRFVPDRAGHDFHYAIDPSKTENDLGWKASIRLRDSLAPVARASLPR